MVIKLTGLKSWMPSEIHVHWIPVIHRVITEHRKYDTKKTIYWHKHYV